MVAVNVALVGTMLNRLAVPISLEVCSDSVGTDMEYLLSGGEVKLDAEARGSPISLPAGRGLPHITLVQCIVALDDVPRVAALTKDALRDVYRAADGKPCGDASGDATSVRFTCAHEGPVFASSGSNEYRLPSLLVDKQQYDGTPSFVQQLHEAIVARLQHANVVVGQQQRTADTPAHLQAEDSNGFSPCWPGNTASASWVHSFLDNSSGREAYLPHVTLGASSVARQGCDRMNARLFSCCAAAPRCQDVSDPLVAALLLQQAADVAVDALHDPSVELRQQRCLCIPGRGLRVVVAQMGNFCSCHNVLEEVFVEAGTHNEF